jgi:hypothetical protein
MRHGLTEGLSKDRKGLKVTLGKNKNSVARMNTEHNALDSRTNQV